MKCGPSFCPISSREKVAFEGTGEDLVNQSAPDIIADGPYCCMRIMQDYESVTGSVSVPFVLDDFCCEWEEFSKNLQALHGYDLTSQLFIAFFPAAVALFLTLLGLVYLLQFICCRLETEPLHEPAHNR